MHSVSTQVREEMSRSTQIENPGLRTDAVENRRRIVTAARELFAEKGIDVPMSAIARRAGVGVATLFRRFPDRRSLVMEVFAEQIEHCESVLDEASDDPDPWNGFAHLVEVIGRMQIDDRGFTEAFLTTFATSTEIDDKRKLAESSFEKLVRRTQQAGKLRADFAASDLSMILLANGGLRDAPPEHARHLSDRLVAYLLQAFSTSNEPVDLPRPSRMGLHQAVPSADQR